MLAGERSAALDPVRDAVLLGAAAALVAHDSVGQPPSSVSVGDRLAAALPRVTEAVDSGAAGALLTRWIDVSSSLAAR
jgi:anthranilate phosphoribosyltransferase